MPKQIGFKLSLVAYDEAERMSSRALQVHNHVEPRGKRESLIDRLFTVVADRTTRESV